MSTHSEDPAYVEAAHRDAADDLAAFRRRFVEDEPDLIYLDGNSLGRMPLDTVRVLDETARHGWGTRLIRSWNDGWWDLQLHLGDLLSPLVGAATGEVMISDSTSVNLYKLASAAVEARPGRSTIVTDDLNFPTDVYVLEGIAASRGLELVIVESDGVHGPLERLGHAVDADTALVALSHTTYLSGYTYDMAAVNRLAHEAGALTLWDTSHSVGSVPIDFTEADTDLAVGCTYKYLNGGPGGPAFLYVPRRLQPALTNPIRAWWAHRAPFDMDLAFEPTDGIRRFHTGTMPILSLAATEPGLRLTAEAGIDRIRAKSVDLTTFFVELWEQRLRPLGFELASPMDPASRGSHVSLRHSHGRSVTRALIELGHVIPDFRAPDIIRFGFASLYTSFVDVATAVERLESLMRQDAHMGVDAGHGTVT